MNELIEIIAKSMKSHEWQGNAPSYDGCDEYWMDSARNLLAALGEAGLGVYPITRGTALDAVLRVIGDHRSPRDVEVLMICDRALAGTADGTPIDMTTEQSPEDEPYRAAALALTRRAE